VEANSTGDQGSRRAVAPSGEDDDDDDYDDTSLFVCIAQQVCHFQAAGLLCVQRRFFDRAVTWRDKHSSRDTNTRQLKHIVQALGVCINLPVK
jgi:hypothetical protein